MTKRSVLLGCSVIGALFFASNLFSSTFVPPPRRSIGSAAMLGAATAASMGTFPAFAAQQFGNVYHDGMREGEILLPKEYKDEIDIAASKLASASYPMLKEVNWNSGLFLANPGKASAAEWTKAIAKAIDMGAAMDAGWLTKGVKAHHLAIEKMDSNLVTTQSSYENILAAIGHMVASVPADKTMAVYNEFGKLVDPAVPNYLMGTVKEADAAAAYNAFMEFKDVVKKVKITPAEALVEAKPQAVTKAVDAAAGKLADASYPFLKEIDWSSNVAVSPTGFAASPVELTKAIDKALVMGAAMDGGALKAAAAAHVKAIGSMDASGVTGKKEYEAVLATLGKAISTVSTGKVMDVYDAFGKVVSPAVPKYLMSSVNSADAVTAYRGFLEFKDAVKAAQLR